MKTASIQKQITMILGVLVALIIVFTLWMRAPKPNQAALPSFEVSGLLKPPAPATLLRLSTRAVTFVKDHF
jgi:hypothetical protein